MTNSSESSGANRMAADGIGLVRELLRQQTTAMLTTIDASGRLHARPMATQQLDFDGELWFFTDRTAHKADEIRARPQVSVTYEDAKAGAFLSLSGNADLVDDPERKRQFWRPLYATWFPGGVADPALTLLRVRVESGEYWDTPHGIAVTIAGFLVGVATGTHPDVSRHGTVDFPTH